MKPIVTSKTTIIPDRRASDEVQKALKEKGPTVEVQDSHADLGVDAGAGNKRVIAKLEARSKDAFRRPKRAGHLVSRKKKAKIIARTGVQAAYIYGKPATGASPEIICLQKSEYEFLQKHVMYLHLLRTGLVCIK